MTEPVPEDQSWAGPVPGLHEACPLCGSIVADAAIHRQWHKGLRNKGELVDQAIATARQQLDTARAAILDLRARVTALESS